MRQQAAVENSKQRQAQALHTRSLELSRAIVGLFDSLQRQQALCAEVLGLATCLEP